MGQAILRLEGISKSFGGLKAVHDLSFDVARGTIKSIIGPNGAGKSTLFNLITGLDAPTAGRIVFDGRHLNGMQPSGRAALGFARTFQTPQVIENMTVLENVLVGRHRHGCSGFLSALMNTRHSRRESDAMRGHCSELLVSIGLGDKLDTLAADLPFGQLKLLEMARALVLEPKLVLLDEFAAGLTRQETEHMMALVRALPGKGVTVLLVEHDMHLVMNLSDEIVVLNFGEKIAEGTPAEIQSNPKVIEVYLGAEA